MRPPKILLCLSWLISRLPGLVYVAAISLILPLQTFAGKTVTVYTTNYPLTYFAKRIGGEYVDVIFPAPANTDPAFWTPDVDTVKQYQQADLIILNGAGYEKWLKKVSLPMLRTVDTSRAFTDKFIHAETDVTHSHGPKGDHSHGGTAFTTWLDFSLATEQAEAIFTALSRKIPARKAELSNNFKALKEDLTQLDEDMAALSASKPGLPLVGSHPIYQYMAKRYKLNMKMVMWEPDVYPDESEWSKLHTLLTSHPAKWMLWEEKPLPESAQYLREMNVTSLVFSPCFSRPQAGDFLSVMKQNVKNMQIISGR